MNNNRAQLSAMHPRPVVRPQLSVSRLPFAPGTGTTIRGPAQPVRNTIIIRAPPPPQPIIIRAPPTPHPIIIRAPPPPQPIIIRAPPIRPTVIINPPAQNAPLLSIVPPPPQPRVQSLIPIHQITMMRPTITPQTITPPTAHVAPIQPPPQAIIIHATPPTPTDEPITFNVKWANSWLHGLVQD